MQVYTNGVYVNASLVSTSKSRLTNSFSIYTYMHILYIFMYKWVWMCTYIHVFTYLN